MTLQKKVTHPCVKPTVGDHTASHRWTCECGSRWEFHPYPKWPTEYMVERYGFLWLKSRRVYLKPIEQPGYWRLVHRVTKWVDIEDGS